MENFSGSWKNSKGLVVKVEKAGERYRFSYINEGKMVSYLASSDKMESNLIGFEKIKVKKDKLENYSGKWKNSKGFVVKAEKAGDNYRLTYFNEGKNVAELVSSEKMEKTLKGFEKIKAKKKEKIKSSGR